MWTVKIKTLNEDMVVAVLILRSSRQEYSQIFVLWKSCKITKYRFFVSYSVLGGDSKQRNFSGNQTSFTRKYQESDLIWLVVVYL